MNAFTRFVMVEEELLALIQERLLEDRELLDGMRRAT